jgi:hypothetical protein
MAVWPMSRPSCALRTVVASLGPQQFVPFVGQTPEVGVDAAVAVSRKVAKPAPAGQLESAQTAA